VYLAVQGNKNPSTKLSGSLATITLHDQGTHYKITKVNNSMQLKKVVTGKEALMTGGDLAASLNKKFNKTNGGKNRQLIHNSSLKFANHRSGSTSPSPR